MKSRSDSESEYSNWERFMLLYPNDQLTDGGPPPTSELPNGFVGPPFVGAACSAPLFGSQSPYTWSNLRNTHSPTSMNGSATAMIAAVWICVSQQMIPVGRTTMTAQQRARRALILVSSFIRNPPNVRHEWCRANDVRHTNRTHHRHPLHVACWAHVVSCLIRHMPNRQPAVHHGQTGSRPGRINR